MFDQAINLVRASDMTSICLTGWIQLQGSRLWTIIPRRLRLGSRLSCKGIPARLRTRSSITAYTASPRPSSRPSRAMLFRDKTGLQGCLFGCLVPLSPVLQHFGMVTLSIRGVGIPLFNLGNQRIKEKETSIVTNASRNRIKNEYYW